MLGTKQIVLIGVGATSVAGIGTGIYFSQQDNTIRGKLISEGIELISSQTEYWISFNESKKEKGFIDLIKNGNEDTRSWKMREGGKALSTWCNNNLKLTLTKDNSESLLGQVKKYCSKPPLNIEAKMKKLGKKWVTNWKEKLDLLKKTPEAGLVEELKKTDTKVINLDIPEQEVVFKALEKWCKKNTKKSLINPEIDTVWEKLEKRCFEQENDS